MPVVVDDVLVLVDLEGYSQLLEGLMDHRHI
jgi:hypothetical protein